MDDWPKDIIFFLRVASLLHGLSIQLKAKVPFFEILVRRAQQALDEHGKLYREPHVHLALRSNPRSLLEWKIHKALLMLIERNSVLGCQVVVWHGRNLVSDVAIGKMGPSDSRPVTNETLFTGFSLTNLLLIIMILHLVSVKRLKLGHCVSEWWDQFIRHGKRSITVEQILTHQSGVHDIFPTNLTLSTITDYKAMVRLIENAKLKCSPGKCGHYPYGSVGWILSELIASVTKQNTKKYFRNVLAKEWRLRHLSRGLYLSLPSKTSIITKVLKAEGRKAEFLAQTLMKVGDDLSPKYIRSSSFMDFTPKQLHFEKTERWDSDGEADRRRSVSSYHSARRASFNKEEDESEDDESDFSAEEGPDSDTRSVIASAERPRKRHNTNVMEMSLSDSEVHDNVIETSVMDQVPEPLLRSINRRISGRSFGFP